MKRLSLILMSVALMLGMAQCKKNVEPIAATTSGTMNITLDVDGGSKVSVTPSTGVVSFQTGDKIYVASNGVYVGTLTHNGSNFTGNISGATADEPLYFYFVGNKNPWSTLTAGASASLTVDIYDQTEGYPVISAAPSNENFSTSTYTYTATLLNKCALVKFNVTTSSDAPTVIAGVNNKLVITFSDSGVGTFTNSKIGEGLVKLPAGSGEKWAILLPNASATAAGSANDTTAYSSDWGYIGYRGAIPVITDNGYETSGIAVTISSDNNHTLPGKFAVSTSTNVRFAAGNLQWLGSGDGTGTWQFASNQYDYFGAGDGANGAITIDGYTSYNVYNNVIAGNETTEQKSAAYDMFGWGCTGYQDASANGSQNYYLPYQSYTGSSYNANQYYGPTGSATSISVANKSDWGYCMDQTGATWYTLDDVEGTSGWAYLLTTRGEAYRGKGRILMSDGSTYINGVFVLPNGGFDSELQSALTVWSNTTSNCNTTYQEAEFAAMERAGAVFLPAAGYRNETGVVNVCTFGDYWSATPSSTTYAYNLRFRSDSNWYPLLSNYRSVGRSVRLVRPVSE